MSWRTASDKKPALVPPPSVRQPTNNVAHTPTTTEERHPALVNDTIWTNRLKSS